MADNGFGGRALQARLDFAARRGRAISQVEVGRALGVTGVTVGRWENGLKQPDLATITRVAAFYGVSAGWLAFGSESPTAAEIAVSRAVRVSEEELDAATVRAQKERAARSRRKTPARGRRRKRA